MLLRLATFFGAMLIWAISEPVVACRISTPLKPDYVRYADTVVIGRVSNYRYVQSPEATANWDKSYAPWKRPDHLIGDYAIFDVAVDEVLLGNPPSKLSVMTMYGATKDFPAGQFLFALNKPSPATAPDGDQNASSAEIAERRAFGLLERMCSGSFVFESSSDEAKATRQLLERR